MKLILNHFPSVQQALITQGKLGEWKVYKISVNLSYMLGMIHYNGP